MPYLSVETSFWEDLGACCQGILQDRGMASFADVLTPEDTEAIHAYLIARGNEDYADAAARAN